MRSLLAPFKMIQIAQFLPTLERDALYEAVCANQAAFQPPGGLVADVGGALYLSLESDQDDGPGMDRLRKASECLSSRILAMLPTLFTALGVEPFAVKAIPLNFINGRDGHSGLPHADSLDGRFKISLLYYFHRTPKAFRGGDLEFYESDAGSPNGHGKKAITRIACEDNLLIAFPSQTFHGITGVLSDSDQFVDGRFAAVGFLGAQ